MIALHGAAQAGEQPRHGIGIGIVPAADGQDRRLDGGEILGHRAVLPIGIAARMAQPIGGQEGFGGKTLQPHGAPALADQHRIGRAGGIGQHGAAPAEIFVDDAAALEMDVVGVAIIGRAQGDDGLERRRPAGGDLQAVEAAPGDPHHADAAGAPGLGGGPGDDGEGVVLLLPGIFVEHDAVGTRHCHACRRASRHSRDRRNRDG